MKSRYVRWMIRTALIYMVIGTALGLAMHVAYRVPALQFMLAWRTTHVHLILVGAVMQMIMGVALWMFPRRKRQPGWPSERQGFFLYATFNSGTVLRSLFGPFVQGSALTYGLSLTGAVLQVIGLGYFAALAFGRVRGPQPDPPAG